MLCLCLLHFLSLLLGLSGHLLFWSSSNSLNCITPQPSHQLLPLLLLLSQHDFPKMQTQSSCMLLSRHMERQCGDCRPGITRSTTVISAVGVPCPTGNPRHTLPGFLPSFRFGALPQLWHLLNGLKFPRCCTLSYFLLFPSPPHPPSLPDLMQAQLWLNNTST